MSNILWTTIAKLPGVGPKTLIKLYRDFSDLNLSDFLGLHPNLLFNTIRNQKIVNLLTDKDYMKTAIEESEIQVVNYKKMDVEVISIADSRYPSILRQIEDPPPILYCRGNLDALEMPKKVAIVGTRNATLKGKNAAAKIAAAFTKLNYAIVSGLAHGIDTAGHIGALETEGITIAVLPGGVDSKSIYPAKNKALAEKIVQNNGLLVSEYPPGIRPQKAAFVQRDRIQSGLSLGVCPVQTDIVGGTQHTIKFTQKQKRVLFCPIPTEEGHLEMTAYKGIHKLISEGKAFILNGKEDYQRLDNLMTELLTSNNIDLELLNSKKTKNKQNDGYLNEDKNKSTRINDESDGQLSIFNLNNKTDEINGISLDKLNSIIDQYRVLCQELKLDLTDAIEMIKNRWKS